MVDIVYTTPSGVAVKPALAARSHAGASSSEQTAPSSDLGAPMARLYVQPDGAAGYVYQLVDTATGRLLAEVPRAKSGDLKTLGGYSTGALVSTQA